VAAFAATVSYSHICDLGHAHGQSGTVARLLLSVDGMIVAASMLSGVRRGVVTLRGYQALRAAPGAATCLLPVPRAQFTFDPPHGARAGPGVHAGGAHLEPAEVNDVERLVIGPEANVDGAVERSGHYLFKRPILGVDPAHAPTGSRPGGRGHGSLVTEEGHVEVTGLSAPGGRGDVELNRRGVGGKLK
jgi:hypothetical protein